MGAALLSQFCTGGPTPVFYRVKKTIVLPWHMGSFFTSWT